MLVSNEEIEQRVRPHLPAGERFIAAFQAAEGIAARLSFRYRVVAVTDHQIYVWRAKPLQVCSPGKLLSSHPLDAMTERPLRALATARQIVIGGRRLWVTLAYARMLDVAFAATPGRPVNTVATTRIKQTHLVLWLPAVALVVLGVVRIVSALVS